MKERGFGAHMMTQGGLQNALRAGQEYGCDVIQLFTATAGGEGSLSGTVLSTEWNQPIQVVSGVPCAGIPDDNLLCQHIEESVLFKA